MYTLATLADVSIAVKVNYKINCYNSIVVITPRKLVQDVARNTVEQSKYQDTLSTRNNYER